MLDIGWAELMVIGVVALIVVGPKDLPKLFQSLGQWVGRARGLARDFQRAMNDAAEDSGLADIKKGFNEASDIKGQMGLDGWDDAVKAVKDPLGVKGAVKNAVLGNDEAVPVPEAAKAKKPATKRTAAKKATPKKPAAKKPAAKKVTPKPAAAKAAKPKARAAKSTKGAAP